MKMRWTARRSLTLIEVVASLLILGGSVTILLVALSNSLDRLSYSRRQLGAQHMAHELFTTWALQGEDLSAEASGTMPDAHDWVWRRFVERKEIADGVAARQVTLRLTHRSRDGFAKPWVREYHRLIEEPP